MCGLRNRPEAMTTASKRSPSISQAGERRLTGVRSRIRSLTPKRSA